MIRRHTLPILFAAILPLAIAGCSGLAQTSSGGGGTGGGGGSTTYTIGGSVTGLAGTGLILQDNGGDSLGISANGNFTFKTPITSGGTYSVTVQTQPSTPSQTCVVANGSGTATANVSTVTVTCTTGAYTIGGTVTGLSGKGLVLQDNATDNLTITANGAFTFATPIVLNSTYSVTVLTQPTSPTQICAIANATGTVTGNVGNVNITCSTGTIPIGGAVAGLAGTGLVLQDNGGDNLTVNQNGSFQFPTLLSSGATYTVTVMTQPQGPNQVCTVSNGTGTAAAPAINNVQITCPAVYHRSSLR